VGVRVVKFEPRSKRITPQTTCDDFSTTMDSITHNHSEPPAIRHLAISETKAWTKVSPLSHLSHYLGIWDECYCARTLSLSIKPQGYLKDPLLPWG
jgi:hypothetical protein